MDEKIPQTVEKEWSAPLTASFGLCHICPISDLVSKATRVSFISSLKQNFHILDNPSTHLIPGEVSVVLVDQIFLDPEIIVAGWKEHDLLMWGVVTIPKARFNRIPRYPSKLFRDTFKKAAKAGPLFCPSPPDIALWVKPLGKL